MSEATTVDLTGLNHTMAELTAVLGLDMKEVVRVQAAALAAQIADGLGPKTEAKGKARVKRGIKRSFFPLNSGIKPWMGTGAGKGDIHWLFATKGKKTPYPALVGADAKDVRLDLTATAMRKMRSDRATAAWQNLGEVSGSIYKHYAKFNKTQHAMKIDRVIVTAEAFKTFLAGAQKRIGQLKASFSYTADNLGRKEKRGWVSAHFPNKAGGKAVFNNAPLQHPTQPFIEFGSRAKGVESSPEIQKVIHGSIGKRANMMAKTMEKVWSGYAYNLKTGQTFKPKAGEEVPEGWTSL